jgi:glutathione synthase/RimK-type ligase-like ATP-grasp enzyme
MKGTGAHALARERVLDIIIIAAEDDLHAQCVTQVIRNEFGKECLIWNNSRLPAADQATIHLSQNAQVCSLVSDGSRYDLGDVTSVWWRRPEKPKIDEKVTQDRVRNFCEEETTRFFKGLATVSSTTLINDPDAQDRANRKAAQLKLARELGLKIPETIMTNDPDVVSQYVHQTKGRCIYKTFRSPRWQFVETRLMQEGDLHQLESLKHAPIIVQRYIRRGRDIRATVIGNKVFCASATLRDKNAEVDWRLDPAVKWHATRIPDSLETLLVTYVAQLGLHYGCIDLRQDPDGDTYFLEINPSGQFLFVEVDTGLPIVSAFAAMLCEPVSVFRPHRPPAPQKRQ